PDDPDQRDIEIKILGESKTDAGNLASLARTHQSLAGDYSAHTLAAVGTKKGIVRNRLAAVVAIHELFPSTQPLAISLWPLPHHAPLRNAKCLSPGSTLRANG